MRPVLGGLAVAGPAAFTTAWVAASASRPGSQPWRSDISALAALDAPHPWITMTGKLLLAAGILALATGLASVLPGRETAVGVGLLGVAALAIAIAALARQDCDPALAMCAARQRAGQLSWHHSLHDYASGGYFLASLATPLVLARPLRADPRRRPLAAYSVITTIAGLALFVGYLATPDQWAGLVQRVFLTTLVAWTAVLGTSVINGAADTRGGAGFAMRWGSGGGTSAPPPRGGVPARSPGQACRRSS